MSQLNSWLLTPMRKGTEWKGFSFRSSLGLLGEDSAINGERIDSNFLQEKAMQEAPKLGSSLKG